MRTVLAAVWGVAILLVAVGVGFVIGTALVLPFAVLPRGRRERYAMVGASLWARIVVWGLLLARPEVTGRVALREGEGALLVCNHRSWLDPLLLLATTRSNGLSKAEIAWIPFVGWYGYLAGAVFFRRENRKRRLAARDEVLWLVERGHRIHVFPEGTRSRDGALGRRVFLRLVEDAWERGIPVVPCAVMYTERVLPPGVFGAFPLQAVRLHLGETLRKERAASAEALGELAWARVAEMVGALETEGAPGLAPPAYQSPS